MSNQRTAQPCHWALVNADGFERSVLKYSKNHPRETKAVLERFDTLHLTLEMGTHPQHFAPSWIHREPKGIKAISEQGKEDYLKATRLYIYIESDKKCIHLLKIGDKGSQGKDINICKKMVDKIRKS